MAWALVQATDAAIGTKAFASSPTTGNLIVCAGAAYATGQTITVSDTIGNTWTKNSFSCTDASDTITICWAINKSTAADTVSLGPTTAGGEMYIAEFSGVPTSAGQDGSAATNQNTTGAPVSAITTSFVNDLILSYASINGTLTVGAPWTAAATVTGDGGLGYYAPGSTGTFSPAFTQSPAGSWGGITIAIGAAGGAAASIPDLIMAPPHR